jgi:hypothetical protein
METTSAVRQAAAELSVALASVSGVLASDEDVLRLAEIAKRAVDEIACALEALTERVLALEGRSAQ